MSSVTHIFGSRPDLMSAADWRYLTTEARAYRWRCAAEFEMFGYPIVGPSSVWSVIVVRRGDYLLRIHLAAEAESLQMGLSDDDLRDAFDELAHYHSPIKVSSSGLPKNERPSS